MKRLVTERAGLLPIDKPEGPTSHDQVALARKLLDMRRIGHTGTLDPFASGLLLLCLGWATRLAEYMAPLAKRYSAVARLGTSTSTDDRTGDVVATSDGWHDIPESAIRAALRKMVGELEQRPPAYSAKKLGGERAYQIARRGGEPELPTQRVEVYRIEAVEVRPPLVAFDVECSSGTYIRSLARDLGEHLKVGAHLERLRRTAIGDFRVEDAVTLTSDGTPERLEQAILPPSAAVTHLPRAELEAEARRPLSQGRPVPWSSGPTARPVAVYTGGELTAIAQVRGDKLWPRKVLVR